MEVTAVIRRPRPLTQATTTTAEATPIGTQVVAVVHVGRVWTVARTPEAEEAMGFPSEAPDVAFQGRHHGRLTG